MQGKGKGPDRPANDRDCHSGLDGGPLHTDHLLKLANGFETTRLKDLDDILVSNTGGLKIITAAIDRLRASHSAVCQHAKPETECSPCTFKSSLNATESANTAENWENLEIGRTLTRLAATISNLEDHVAERGSITAFNNAAVAFRQSGLVDSQTPTERQQIPPPRYELAAVESAVGDEDEELQRAIALSLEEF